MCSFVTIFHWTYQRGDYTTDSRSLFDRKIMLARPFVGNGMHSENQPLLNYDYCLDDLRYTDCIVITCYVLKCNCGSCIVTKMY